MIKHVILWQLKDELSEDEKRNAKKAIKEALEGLNGRLEGLVDIKVATEGLPNSSADLYLDSAFESVEALKFYADHPEHVKIKDELVVPNVKSRLHLDYEVGDL